MSGASKIEWTDATWNPIVGCSIVSPGCKNCYAMRDAWRKHHSPAIPHYRDLTKSVKGNAVWTGKLALAPDHILTAPLHWKKPRRIFVNSMGDLFHEDAPDEWIDKVFAVMALSPQHTFQVLTKRAERMRKYFAEGRERMHTRWLLKGSIPDDFPLPNVWLGVSAERQQEADERIPHLLATPAAIRFVSAEPLLGPIDLGDRLRFWHEIDCDLSENQARNLVPKARLDWVIVGGESGASARPMHPLWADEIREQCSRVGVPFFFKQWGSWAPQLYAHTENGETKRLIKLVFDKNETIVDYDDRKPPHFPVNMKRVGKKRAGRLLDGKEHNGFPS